MKLRSFLALLVLIPALLVAADGAYDPLRTDAAEMARARKVSFIVGTA